MQTNGILSKPRKTSIPGNIATLAIARWVRGKREVTGMTQSQLAEELGISQALVSRIERGEENISLRTVVQILSSLGGELSVVPMSYEAINPSGIRETEQAGGKT